MSAENVVVAHFIPDTGNLLFHFLCLFKELTLTFIDFSLFFKFHRFLLFILFFWLLYIYFALLFSKFFFPQRFLKWKPRLLIWDIFNVYILSAITFPLRLLWLFPQILIGYIFIFIKLSIFYFPWHCPLIHGIFKDVLFSFQCWNFPVMFTLLLFDAIVSKEHSLYNFKYRTFVKVVLQPRYGISWYMFPEHLKEWILFCCID